MTAMKDTEALAIAQALHNVVGEHVSTKKPDNLRARVDDQYRGLFDACGAKSFDVTVNGSKVGTYSVRTSKFEKASSRQVLDLTDQESYERYVQHDVDRDILVDYVLSQDPEGFAQHCLSLGVLPQGTRTRTVVSEGTGGGEYLGGTLKVDARLVADAMGDALPGVVAGLLGGAE